MSVNAAVAPRLSVPRPSAISWALYGLANMVFSSNIATLCF